MVKVFWKKKKCKNRGRTTYYTAGSIVSVPLNYTYPGIIVLYIILCIPPTWYLLYHLPTNWRLPAITYVYSGNGTLSFFSPRHMRLDVIIMLYYTFTTVRYTAVSVSFPSMISTDPSTAALPKIHTPRWLLLFFVFELARRRR